MVTVKQPIDFSKKTRFELEAEKQETKEAQAKATAAKLFDPVELMRLRQDLMCLEINFLLALAKIESIDYCWSLTELYWIFQKPMP